MTVVASKSAGNVIASADFNAVVNKIQNASDTDVKVNATGYVRAADGLKTKTKAGTPVDGDFTTTPIDGYIAVDTTNNKFYFRSGAIWREAGGSVAANSIGSTELRPKVLIEPFFRSLVSDNWATSTTGTATIVFTDDTTLRLSSGTTSSSTAAVTSKFFAPARQNYTNIVGQTRAKVTGGTVTSTRNTTYLSLNAGAGGYASFIGFPGVTSVRCNSNNGTTTQTTDVGISNVTTTWQVFKIVVSSTDVKFYDDDVLKATHATSFPLAANKYDVRAQVANQGEAALIQMELDWIKIEGVV